MSDLKSELAELKAKAAAKAAARAEAEEQAALEDELAKAKAQDAFDEAWDKAVSTLGRKNIARVDTLLGPAIVKRPDGALFKRFADSEKSDSDECIKLILPCRVYPAADVFDRWLDNTPGVIPDFVLAVSALAGSKKAEQLKK